MRLLHPAEEGGAPYIAYVCVPVRALYDTRTDKRATERTNHRTTLYGTLRYRKTQHEHILAPKCRNTSHKHRKQKKTN